MMERFEVYMVWEPSWLEAFEPEDVIRQPCNEMYYEVEEALKWAEIYGHLSIVTVVP